MRNTPSVFDLATIDRRRWLGLSMGLALLPQRSAAAADLQVQRLGWAGIRIQFGSTTLHIDPLLNPKVWGTALPEPLPAIDAAEGDRYVLVTHRHPDHFDPIAVQAALGEGGALISADAVGLLPAPPGSRSRAVPLYEPQLLGELSAVAVPAADGYGDPQVSWIVSGGGRRVLHCGDTLWHGHWWKIGRQYGPFDAVFCRSTGRASAGESRSATSRA
jgi:L-ascorbate metabolism protein UlaG (beta-lactamase superfamily)